MNAEISNGFLPVIPNMPDYESCCRSMHWQQEEHRLAGLPNNNGLNIAYEAVDRHAGSKLASTVALRWIRKNRSVKDYTYADLQRLTSRFANVLADLGIKKGAPSYDLRVNLKLKSFKFLFMGLDRLNQLFQKHSRFRVI